jgi:hypothetical protein
MVPHLPAAAAQSSSGPDTEWRSYFPLPRYKFLWPLLKKPIYLLFLDDCKMWGENEENIIWICSLLLSFLPFSDLCRDREQRIWTVNDIKIYKQESNECTLLLKLKNLLRFVISMDIFHLITHYNIILALKLSIPDMFRQLFCHLQGVRS